MAYCVAVFINISMFDLLVYIVIMLHCCCILYVYLATKQAAM
jgi:hypothetical protein